MGLVKQAIIEAERYVLEETCVNFICPECGDESNGYAEIPKIDQEFTDDIDTDVDVQCIWCNKNFDAIVHLGASGCTMELDEYPNTKVDFEPVYFSSPFDHDDEWYEVQYYFEHSNDPYPVFIRSYEDIESFLNAYGDEDGHNAMNRMIFAQCFSMYEAYLCDAYLNLVFDNEEKQNIFIKDHKEIKKIGVPISELAAHRKLTADQIVRAKITHTIKETLFHNLSKAVELYRIYDIDIFRDDNEKDQLFKAVIHRHDCVHRNGCDKEGNRLDVYSKTYVKKIADAMKSSASFIQDEICVKMFDKIGI